MIWASCICLYGNLWISLYLLSFIYCSYFFLYCCISLEVLESNFGSLFRKVLELLACNVMCKEIEGF